jgi:hypothetical protein
VPSVNTLSFFDKIRLSNTVIHENDIYNSSTVRLNVSFLCPNLEASNAALCSRERGAQLISRLDQFVGRDSALANYIVHCALRAAADPAVYVRSWKEHSTQS